MIHLALRAEEYFEKKIIEIGKFGETFMKSVAPRPVWKAFGKGSHSKGDTKSSIMWKRTGKWSVMIEPFQYYYVQYAENGRPGIHKSNGLMVFRDGLGRLHRAKSVGPMEGWHFAEQTAAAIRARYGG